MYKRILNVRKQQKWREKNKNVLLKFHFFLSSFKHLAFPWLEVKLHRLFPDREEIFFPDQFLTCGNHIIT